MITTFAEFLLLEYSSHKLSLQELKSLKDKTNSDKLLKLMGAYNNQELFNMSCKIGFVDGVKKSLESDGVKMTDLELYSLMKNSDNIDKSTNLLLKYFKDNKNKIDNIVIYYLINVVDFRTIEKVLDKELIKKLPETDRKYVLDEMTQLQGKKFFIEKLFKKYENK